MIGKNVIPALELSGFTSKFKTTADDFMERGLPLAMAVNRMGGLFHRGHGRGCRWGLSGDEGMQVISKCKGSSIIPSFAADSNALEVMDAFREVGVSASDMLIVIDHRDFIDRYRTLFSENPPRHTFFCDDRQISYFPSCDGPQPRAFEVQIKAS